ncbi:MUS81 endonuclease [Cryptosporidium ubiquitum]|uniref:Crossover junction endonuclease MUS81 n=1 Tax=Cryptosporidium ubiquitum TaxID=857276 RepID=A0A1J4MKP9_9CRYT|nr:MUS81 endonuclease [Cryptosporidium ubiquitum]OII74784.1 MUS81 endonuclease [Cryptosporidium ubiquitum]
MENFKILNSIKIRKKRSTTNNHENSTQKEEKEICESEDQQECITTKSKKFREEASEENNIEEILLKKSPYIGKAHPFNLIYLDYLERMKKTTKTIQRMSMIKKAINSIKQYPVPIISHQQFQILEGIGNYLGSQLEKLIKSDRMDQLKDLKEYQQKCDEYRKNKINDLNLIVDPILAQNPEADNSILEALEEEKQDGEDKIIGTGNNNKNLNPGTPQIYGERWSIIVIIALLKALKPLKDVTLESIQGLYCFLKESYEPKMTIKKAEKTIKKLIKEDFIQVNKHHFKIQGFPIESEKISYNLTDKGNKISIECLKCNELFDYIFTNYNKEQFNNIMSQNNLFEMIKSFDSKRKTKVFIDYEIVMIIDYREVNTYSNSLVGNFNRDCVSINYDNKNDKYKATENIDEFALTNTNSNNFGSKSSGIPKYLLNRLKDQGINIELKNLPIGDIIWVARPKLEDKDEITPIDDSFVLPWIIERKTGSDMCSSILDGRYEEQKYRLMRSIGVENVIYLLEDLNSIHENIVWSSSNNGPISSGRIAPKQVLRSAQANTQFIAGFHILQSQSIGHTLTLLIGMHQMITRNVRNRWCDSELEDNEFKTRVIANIAKNRPSFKDWELHSKKSSNLTVEETFGKQLRSIKGCGPEATETLLEIWPTPYKMYEEMSSEITFDDLYSKVLKKCDEIKSMKFGSKKKHKPSVSRDLLFYLYCLFSENIQNGDLDIKLEDK